MTKQEAIINLVKKYDVLNKDDTWKTVAEYKGSIDEIAIFLKIEAPDITSARGQQISIIWKNVDKKQ